MQSSAVFQVTEVSIFFPHGRSRVPMDRVLPWPPYGSNSLSKRIRLLLLVCLEDWLTCHLTGTWGSWGKTTKWKSRQWVQGSFLQKINKIKFISYISYKMTSFLNFSLIHDFYYNLYQVKIISIKCLKLPYW